MSLLCTKKKKKKNWTQNPQVDLNMYAVYIYLEDRTEHSGNAQGNKNKNKLLLVPSKRGWGNNVERKIPSKN